MLSYKYIQYRFEIFILVTVRQLFNSQLKSSFKYYTQICYSYTFLRQNKILTFIFSDFQIFRPGYHWRDLISRNAHLVLQDWYRIGYYEWFTDMRITGVQRRTCCQSPAQSYRSLLSQIPLQLARVRIRQDSWRNLNKHISKVHSIWCNISLHTE
jgi:hypothetical protein